MIKVSTGANKQSIYFTALMPCDRMCFATPTTLLVTQASRPMDAQVQGSSANVKIGVNLKLGPSRIRPVGGIFILMILHSTL